LRTSPCWIVPLHLNDCLDQVPSDLWGLVSFPALVKTGAYTSAAPSRDESSRMWMAGTRLPPDETSSA
jgi:hypothetical protein